MNENPSSKTVVAAMSGGVDSSVAAALLKKKGYRVIGVMLKLWTENNAPANRCCTPSAMVDAEEVADMLDIPFYVKDYKQIFRDEIVNYFLDGHAQGETPNPCLICNREVRFGHLLQEALELGADYLATGHYAQVEGSPETGFQLKMGKDEAKDQSYMLHRLDQNRLSKALFPVGNYSKTEIRKIAAELGLTVHNKQDSQDLCFISEAGHGDFLQRNLPRAVKKGLIVNTRGEKLGEHQGLGYYTIGQRKGLGISWSEPLYVKKLDLEKNKLVVGTYDECFVSEFSANRIHEINPGCFQVGEVIDAKIRYKSDLYPMEILDLANNKMRIRSLNPLHGVTPGQALVFYRETRCLGGAIICKD